MKRTMIIVWRWDLNFLLSSKKLCDNYVYITFEVENHQEENKLICIGEKDKKENKSQKNSILELIEQLTNDNATQYLILLHQGAGISKEDIQKKNNIEGCLFSGGNEPIHLSRRNDLGLINTGQERIHDDAFNTEKKVIKKNFEYVWNYYTKKKMDDLYHIFSLKAITCLGILECIEEKNYENARKYFSQTWKENTFKNILEKILSEEVVVKKVLEIDLKSIDEKSVAFQMAKELKKKIELLLLKPQYYKSLTIDNIEKKIFSFLLKRYLDWFGNFSDVLKKYRCEGG